MPRLSVGLMRDRLLLVGLEAFELDFQVVGAGEDDSLVAATSVGHAGCDGLRADVRDRDGRARKHAATAVLDRARTVDVVAWAKTATLVTSRATSARAATRPTRRYAV